jgi:hypothetical protein
LASAAARARDDHHDDDHYHDDGWYANPVAVGVADGVTTAVVVGATVASLPPSCSSIVVNGIAYQHCGPNWYQPQYVGTQVQYIVVTAPG